jgi:hypothetical protein
MRFVIDEMKRWVYCVVESSLQMLLADVMCLNIFECHYILYLKGEGKDTGLSQLCNKASSLILEPFWSAS